MDTNEIPGEERVLNDDPASQSPRGDGRSTMFSTCALVALRLYRSATCGVRRFQNRSLSVKRRTTRNVRSEQTLGPGGIKTENRKRVVPRAQASYESWWFSSWFL